MQKLQGEYLVVTFAPGWEFVAGFGTQVEAEAFIEEHQDSFADYVAVIKAEVLFAR